METNASHAAKRRQEEAKNPKRKEVTSVTSLRIIIIPQNH
jgi:hypothetical protein